MNEEELDDLFDNIRSTCDDCDHPRCLARIEYATTEINSLLLKARLDELEKLMGTPLHVNLEITVPEYIRDRIARLKAEINND